MTATALRISEEEQERRRVVDRLLEQTAPGRPDFGGATLEQVLGLSEPVKGLFREFVSPPVPLSMLVPLLRYLGEVQAQIPGNDIAGQVQAAIAIAGRILCVEEDGHLRYATESEIGANFGLNIIEVVADLLKRAGLSQEEEGEKKGPGANPTGEGS